MGVEFMQSNSLYSQLFNQVGSLLHVGQHEACHSIWKQYRGGSGDGGGGYFKQLLEGELESSITSSHYVSTTAEEDLKPLIVRSLEINGNLGTPTNQLAHTLGHVDTAPPPAPPPSRAMLAAPHEDSDHRASPCSDCLDSKPSTIKSPLCNPSSSKRARESCTHNEGMEGPCKKEKKASADKEIKGKKGGQLGAATAGRKASCVKAKAPAKPVLHAEELKLDYVHVRARRGQATDSHSLAERVRREKISERMRFLQDLVPGCSKITGKALVLDEIINYVQSLQNQVEFLAMRLAAVHPKVDHLNFHHSIIDEEIASPFFEEEAKEHVDMLPKTLRAATPTYDLHFESLPLLYSSFFDEPNFNASMVSDLSTSTCNDSNTTNTMDFSHLS